MNAPILVASVPSCGAPISLAWSGAQPDTGWYSVQWVPAGTSFDTFTMFNVRGTSITLPNWFMAGVAYKFRVFAMREDWDGSAHTDENVTPSSNLVELTIPECPAVSGGPSIARYSWRQQGSDIDGVAPLDLFGNSVAMSGDGSVVAIGAPGNDGNGPDAGQVQVFAWDGSAWTQRGIDLDGEATDDNFGQSVALSTDGTILAVGAYLNDGSGGDAGHVRVFAWDGTAWVQRGVDIDGEAAGDLSGISVALSNDGTIVAIGAPGNDNSVGVAAGHVRAFAWNGLAWAQQGGDLDGEAAGDESGWAVAISGDGATLAVGAPSNGSSGHVRVFAWSGAVWAQRGNDIDGDGPSDRGGRSVALSDDGSVLAIGMHTNDNDNGVDAGRVRVFAWNGLAWGQQGADIDGESVASVSGYSVALSTDGTLLSMGGVLNSGVNGPAGHVRVYAWR